MKFDDNEECMNILRILESSLGNRLREVYNKGYKDGLREGASRVVEKIAEKILEETEGE